MGAEVIKPKDHNIYPAVSHWLQKVDKEDEIVTMYIRLRGLFVLLSSGKHEPLFREINYR